MKRLLSLSFIALCTFMVSCNTNTESSKTAQGSDSLPASNPFYAPSTLSYGVPAFDKIKDSDFKPAMEAGMKAKLAEIQKITENPAAPEFENTLAALEKSGQLLSRVNHVFNLLAGANTNPELQKIREELAPKLAATNDAIYLNTTLFERVATIYSKRDSLPLDAESKRLLEYYYQQFELAGANLSEQAKAKLKA